MKKKSNKKPLVTRVAIKLCEPYMALILESCYNLRSFSYDLSFAQWSNLVKEQINKCIERG